MELKNSTEIDVERLARRVAVLESEDAALRAEASARQVEGETLAALESLLAHAPVGFAFFDRELRFVRLNAVGAKINGLPSAAHIGRRVHEIAPVNARVVDPMIEEVFRTGEPVSNLEI